MNTPDTVTYIAQSPTKAAQAYECCGDSTARDNAIAAAKEMDDPYASVLMVVRSGSHTSRTVIWPERGETYTY